MTTCICNDPDTDQVCPRHGWNPFHLRLANREYTRSRTQAWESNRRLRRAIREAQVSAERKNKIIRDLQQSRVSADVFVLMMHHERESDTVLGVYSNSHAASAALVREYEEYTFGKRSLINLQSDDVDLGNGSSLQIHKWEVQE
jgi:hypothetical protein